MKRDFDVMAEAEEDNLRQRSAAEQTDLVETQVAMTESQEVPRAQTDTATAPTAQEIRQTLLRCGLARTSRRATSATITPVAQQKPHLAAAVHQCLVNKLPTEMRQRIFLFLLDAPASELETWDAPFFGGIGNPERLITVPCKIDWWLAVRRFLMLSQTCTRWRTELSFVARIQLERAKTHRDELMTTLLRPGLQRLREKTPTPQYARLMSYLTEFRKSEDGSLLHVLTRIELRSRLWSAFARQLPIGGRSTSHEEVWEETLRSLHKTAITHHKRAGDHGNELYESCKLECWKLYVSCGQEVSSEVGDGPPEYSMDISV